MAKHKEQLAQLAWYPDSLAHLVDELRRLDTLIQQHIATLRPRRLATQGMAAAKGVYITHEEVDALLDQEDAMMLSRAPRPSITWKRPPLPPKLLRAPCREFSCRCPTSRSSFRCRRSRCKPSSCVWLRNCAASTIRSMRICKMTLPAKGQVSILVLDLLCTSEAERWRARTTVFSDQAPLFRHGILHKVEDPRSPSGSSGLAQFLQLDQRMLHYLLENDAGDPRLAGYATLLSPAVTIGAGSG